MTKTIEDYARVYRQKQREIDSRKQHMESIKKSAESALRSEAEAIKQLCDDIRHMQKVITTAVETGKDLTEVLLAESNNDAFAVTLWEHDNPLVNDTQIEYTEQQIADFSHQAKILSRPYY